MADPRVTNSANPPWMIYLLAALTVLSGLFVGLTTISLMRNAADERMWVQLATNIQVDSQRLSKASVEAALGNLDAFEELSTVYTRTDQGMRILRTGAPDGEIPPAPQEVPEVAESLGRLSSTWDEIGRNAMIIIEADGLINGLSDASTTLLAAVPGIQERTDRMIRQLIESGAPSQQVFAASRQLVLADRMQRRVNDILQNPAKTEQAAAQLREESDAFARVEAALMSGNQRLGITRVINPQARASLLAISRSFREVRPALEVVLRATDNLAEVRSAADSIYLDSDRMFTESGAFAEAVDALPRTRLWPSTRANSLGLLALLLFSAALVTLVIAKARRRADTAFRSNRRTQQAIVRLLDELSSLAEGDLTAHASVTDDVTGAIADAVNYAVEQLRELVININNTSRAVAESAESTREATSQLAASATEQAGQVGRATEKIQSMSAAFETMAQRSRDSSETALESVAVANSGAEKVRKTISGMDMIREQIQETAKRIKRLGESTQEIGDIVSLINDIAEQTNVLALNAAIQAASAGGQGQGFAVVADEVQQLAESATNATKRISTLVQTIQLDTAEAIKSMESTTSEVVNGARLAQDAGSSLVQIEKTSNELSALIQEIAREADAHSQQARRISELMDGIREVSVKTSRGTSHTADSVRELADLVLELQESVSDFRLPGDGRRRSEGENDRPGRRDRAIRGPLS